jgi:PEP-CTERM motif
MKHALTRLSAAVALLAMTSAHATIETLTVGAGPVYLADPDGSGRRVNLALVSGSGTLTFSNPGAKPDALDNNAVGGALGALNTGEVSLTGGGGIQPIETWKSYGSSGPDFVNVVFPTKAAADADPVNNKYYATGEITPAATRSFRLASAAAAPVNSISVKVDNLNNKPGEAGIGIGSIVTAISSGYALQSATSNIALTGGNIRIENIVFDLYNGKVTADVSGTRSATGTGKAAQPAIPYAAENIALWTFQGIAAGGADIVGPTGVSVGDLLATNNIERLTNPTFCGTACYTLNFTEPDAFGQKLYTFTANTTINNLDMTDAGIAFFQKVLNTSATGTAALVGVDNAVGKWGSVQSSLTFAIAELTPTPGIPEPSTYALMGLGLVGISLAARRRRTL